MFSTGQSVRPEGGRLWTALSGPVRSFSKLALRPGAKDYCNMCTCSGNGTQERAVQDLLCLVDLYLVYLI